MGGQEIELFDPISQPKRLRCARNQEALPENKKLSLEAGTNKLRENKSTQEHQI